MRTWLRVHRAAQVCVALALTAGLVAVAGDVLVPVPGLESVAGVPLALIAPLAASSVLVRGALAGTGGPEAVAVRPVRAYRTGMVMVTCAVSLIAGLGLGEAVPYGAAAARNLVGFTGLAALAALWRRDAATAAPAAYLVTAMLLGGGPGAASWWDWPVAPSPHPATWVVPIACLGLGLAVPALPGVSPRRRSR
ncbi:hypothetical protein JYK22_15360, partial [Nonomuraea sp. RK-328]|nr:hypothetical protein [Nonomuraea sp. RK-328]